MELRNLDYSTIWPDNFFEGDDEDSMSESGAQRWLAAYLEAVLAYFYRVLDYYVSGNILIIQPPYTRIAPDVVVFPVQLSRTERTNLRSWQMNLPNRPAPLVVFEIASDSTWEQDLDAKIVRYAQLGVREYFAYDPYTPQIWQKQGTRLLGWRYTPDSVEVIPADERGHLRSEVLDSTLVPEGETLRLYDRYGNLRLTAEEAERLTREQAEQRELRERQARQQAEQREMQARLERDQAKIARQQAEQAWQQAEQQVVQERQTRQELEERAAQERHEVEQRAAHQQAELEALREQLRKLQSGDASK